MAAAGEIGFEEGGQTRLGHVAADEAGAHRDAVGIVVDFFTNPLSQFENNPAEDLQIPAEIVDQLGNRGTYSDTIDSILYESADSYAQGRQIYLQNRRFELGQEDVNSEIDPFELDTGGF